MGDPVDVEVDLIDGQTPSCVAARVAGGRIRLSPEVVTQTLGWKLETRGLCKGTTCVPTARATGLVDADGIDLVALADLLDRPLAVDVDAHAAALAAGSADRRASMASLEAPDFTLCDLAGTAHSLHEHRGRKVLLVAYASW